MSAIACAIALQTSGGLGDSGNSPGGDSLAGWYVIIALLALVLGLVLLIFLRTSSRRASRR